jgi:hypothetical protein
VDTRHLRSHLGLLGYADVVPRLFPWVSVSVDEEVYDEADHDQWELECVRVDNEGDDMVLVSFDGEASDRLRLSARTPTSRMSWIVGDPSSRSTSWGVPSACRRVRER